MTTIVTVHGTFANHDDEHGELWWQKTSPFHKEIANRIHVDTEEIEWVPFQWSGENSERERRAWGEKLYSFLNENFEKEKRPYHLVGHSHGGSVIAEALRSSAQKDRKLEYLQSWITIATPFLKFKKLWDLHKRLKKRHMILLLGAAVYSIAVLLGALNGLCTDESDTECLVAKQGPVYTEPANILELKPALTEDERIYFESIGTIESMNGSKRYQLPALSYISDKTGPSPLELSFDLISADKNPGPKKVEDQPPLTEKVTNQFKGILENEEIRLDACDANNWKFFDKEITRDQINACAQPGTDHEAIWEHAKQAEYHPTQFWCPDDNDPDKTSCFSSLTFLAAYDDGDGGIEQKKIRVFFSSMTTTIAVIYTPVNEILYSKRFGISMPFLAYLLIMLIPVYVIGYLVWRSQAYRRRRYVPANSQRFSDWYKNSWIKLSHPEDEAINGIAAATNIKKDVNVAPENLLNGWLVVLISFIAASLLFLTPLDLHHSLGSALDFIDYFIRAEGGDVQSIEWNLIKDYKILDIVILVGMITASIAVIAIIAQWLERKTVNPGAKKVIDNTVKAAIAEKAYGNDALGEGPHDCQPYPPEFEDTHKGSLPEIVQKAVEANADKDLTEAAPKLRAALYESANKSGGFKIDELLKKEEFAGILVHTSYFDVEHFHDLFAATLIYTGDFHPKPDFSNYEKAVSWIEEIKSGPKKGED